MEAGGIEPRNGSSIQHQRAHFQALTRRHALGAARTRQQNRPPGPIGLRSIKFRVLEQNRGPHLVGELARAALPTLPL